MIIREVLEKDYNEVWMIFKEVIKTGDTYVNMPDTSKEDMSKIWFAPNVNTFVIENKEEEILGAYLIRPNQIGLGAHIANGAYMVHPNARKNGIGSLLCEHSLKMAKHYGYTAMQFNMVVSTNKHAVTLWLKHGFEIVGIIPKGFKHLQLGYVDAFIMFKEL